MNESILLVEDEEPLRITLGDRLAREGFVLDFAEDGEDALDKVNRLPFDIIILDIMLPLKSGFDVCRDIRHAGIATPIIFLSARSETIDKVVGLRLGADDYLTKPFEAAELLARIEVLLRRVPSKAGQGIFNFGNIRVDLRRGQVTCSGSPIYFTARELQLLRYLIEHAGETVSRADILRNVWGYVDGTFTRTVDTHVASLRQKLDVDSTTPQLIQTVARIGYKFLSEDEIGRASRQQ